MTKEKTQNICECGNTKERHGRKVCLDKDGNVCKIFKPQAQSVEETNQSQVETNNKSNVVPFTKDALQVQVQKDLTAKNQAKGCDEKIDYTPMRTREKNPYVYKKRQKSQEQGK